VFFVKGVTRKKSGKSLASSEFAVALRPLASVRLAATGVEAIS
jgi:hypothetical protein